MLDVRVKKGADIILLGILKVKLTWAHHDSSARPHYKYNTFNLKCNKTAKIFNCTVKNNFSGFEFLDEDLNNHWEGLNKT